MQTSKYYLGFSGVYAHGQEDLLPSPPLNSRTASRLPQDRLLLPDSPPVCPRTRSESQRRIIGWAEAEAEEEKEDPPPRELMLSKIAETYRTSFIKTPKYPYPGMCLGPGPSSDGAQPETLPAVGPASPAA
jgi:hypothetical protein